MYKAYFLMFNWIYLCPNQRTPLYLLSSCRLQFLWSLVLTKVYAIELYKIDFYQFIYQIHTYTHKIIESLTGRNKHSKHFSTEFYFETMLSHHSIAFFLPVTEHPYVSKHGR